MSRVIEKFQEAQVRKDLPVLRPGDTVRIHVRLKEAEGEKERIQPFEGVVIKKRGKSTGASCGRYVLHGSVTWARAVWTLLRRTVLKSAAMARQCSSRFEREARKCGWQRIAGLDEAGRGSLFGPVVAAAVILDPKRRIVCLDDSKKLPAERRETLALRIRERALAWAIAEVDASRIDAWNIYQASRQAMTQALGQLRISPDYLLLDAMELDVLVEQKSLIHGDAL